MDWFTAIVGFDERIGPEAVRARLRVDQGRLISDAGDRHPVIGRLTLPSLAELRRDHRAASGRSTVEPLVGEARALHTAPGLDGALFQAASQFNLLEMAAPDITPEDGVARYGSDHTQGPACAMAVGAATIYRNYLVPVDGHPGQSAQRQLDTVRDLGVALSEGTGLRVEDLWEMRNGYALCSPSGLSAIGGFLRSLSADRLDDLRGLLRIGWVQEAEVTDAAPGSRFVSQALCSALPIAYSTDPGHADWEPFARLILEACYEATLLAGAASHPSRPVLLTRVGGGVFGNTDGWIDDAIARAVDLIGGLDVRVVRKS